MRTRMMKGNIPRKYLYGRCPLCKTVGKHKFKGYTFIIGEGDSSRFKCKKCGKMFGFLLID